MDDEEQILDMVSHLLTRIGYEVALTTDGVEAVELFRKAAEAQEPFDAVVLDLTIPGGMGGREALDLLREFDPEIKAVVSSGYSNDPILADYRSYGFCAVLIKPYNVDELTRILHDILQD